MTTEVVQAEAPASEAAAVISAIERAAVNPAVDAEKMERLFALQERLLAREAEREFNAAMALTQAQIPKIKRNRENSQTRSMYADLEAVTDAAAPVYTRNGFALSFTEEPGAEVGKMRVVCYCSHRAGHTRRYQYDASLDGAGMKGSRNKTDIQSEGSTLSYARRYLTALIFNLTTTDDNDGQSHHAVITEEQVADLRAMAEEVDADIGQFCAWLRVERLSDLPASQYRKALAGLEAKRRKA